MPRMTSYLATFIVKISCDAWNDKAFHAKFKDRESSGAKIVWIPAEKEAGHVYKLEAL